MASCDEQRRHDPYNSLADLWSELSPDQNSDRSKASHFYASNEMVADSSPAGHSERQHLLHDGRHESWHIQCLMYANDIFTKQTALED